MSSLTRPEFSERTPIISAQPLDYDQEESKLLSRISKDWEFKEVVELDSGTSRVTLEDPRASRGVAAQTACTVAYMVTAPLVGVLSLVAAAPASVLTGFAYLNYCTDDCCGNNEYQSSYIVSNGPRPLNTPAWTPNPNTRVETNPLTRKEHKKMINSEWYKELREKPLQDRVGTLKWILNSNVRLYEILRLFGCFCPTETFEVRSESNIFKKPNPEDTHAGEEWERDIYGVE